MERSGAAPPGRTRVVTGGTDASIRLWDPAELEVRRVLDGHHGWVLGVRAGRRRLGAGVGRRETVRSACGTWTPGRCATCCPGTAARSGRWPSLDRTAIGWLTCVRRPDRPRRGRCGRRSRSLCVLRGHTAPVMACVGARRRAGAVRWLRHDRAMLGSARGSRRRPARREHGVILSLAVTPDGTLAIAGTSAGEFLRWSVDGRVGRPPGPPPGPIMSLDFRGDAGLLSGSADKSAALPRRETLRRAGIAARTPRREGDDGQRREGRGRWAALASPGSPTPWRCPGRIRHGVPARRPRSIGSSP